MACLRLPSNSGGIGTVLGVPSGASNPISLVLTSLWVTPSSALPCCMVW